MQEPPVVSRDDSIAISQRHFVENLARVPHQDPKTEHPFAINMAKHLFQICSKRSEALQCKQEVRTEIIRLTMYNKALTIDKAK